MERQIRVATAESVKDLIARAYLAENSPTEATRSSSGLLGSVSLHPHQLSAVRRLIRAIDEFGGALLSDEVGMGKTFVALAVARDFCRCLIVAPAALREMWEHQAGRAGVEVTFLSFERLSRRRPETSTFDLVVIDEAHHVRNRSTIRYHRLARMLRRSRVLMLSATPIHNSRRDITSLLSLFLGARAESLSDSEMARCVVRRRIESLALSQGIPRTGALVWREIENDNEIPKRLLTLPPPVPVRDGGDGGVLIARSLLRQWCSSDAALESALRRRLARSLALSDALESGRYPTEQELSAWTFAEDSLQLAFPSLVATASGNCAELLSSVRRHEVALREILVSLGSCRFRDSTRAEILKGIRAAHADVPVVAFSQYAETVRALFRELRSERGVAALTSKGARVAGGVVTRRDVLARFAPLATGSNAPREIERIDLLLTTDLLSEGVNLQDAGVVVHLDLPWTAARLEQRLGRVRRLGSDHRMVWTYGIRPSGAAEALIGLEKTIRRKVVEMEKTLGVSRPLLPPAETTIYGGPSDDPITVSEHIREILSTWLVESRPDPFAEVTLDALPVAAVQSAQGGFVALCTNESALTLVGFDGTKVTESPSAILDLLRSIGGVSLEPRSLAIVQAQQRLQSWFFTRSTLGVTETESAVTARVRTKALRRISVIVQNARPHARQNILSLAARARNAVLGTLGVGGEAELFDLAASIAIDEDWLRAVIEHNPQMPRVNHAYPQRVIALLLLDLRSNEPSTQKCGDTRKETLSGSIAATTTVRIAGGIYPRPPSTKEGKMRMNWKFPAYFGGLVLAIATTAVSCSKDSTAPQQKASAVVPTRTTQQKVHDLQGQYGWMGTFHTDALGHVYKKLAQNRGASDAQKCKIIGRAIKDFAKTFRKAPGSAGIKTDAFPDNPCDVRFQLSASRQTQVDPSAALSPRHDYATATSLLDQMSNVFDSDQSPEQDEATIYYLESVAASSLNGLEAGAIIGLGSIAISSTQYWGANQGAWNELSTLAYNRLSPSRAPSATVLSGGVDAPRYWWWSPNSKKILKSDVKAGASALVTGFFLGPIDLEVAALRAAAASAITGAGILF